MFLTRSDRIAPHEEKIQMKKKSQVRKDVPWSKRQEIPNPQILAAADQYEEARKLLAKHSQDKDVLLPLMNTATVAVELYLKCLSAERIHVEYEGIPDVSRVYAQPSISNINGHKLRPLLEAVPENIQDSLIDTFNLEFSDLWNQNLQMVLTELDGAFQATRYPFECGTDITSYNFEYLMMLSAFMAHFAKNLSPKDHIVWK
jgi:hypothetical protein